MRLNPSTQRIFWIGSGVFALLCAVSCQSRTSPTSTNTEPATIPWRSPDVTSNLNIPERETFVLGGGQSHTYIVAIENKGTSSVRVSRGSAGKPTEIVALAPGDAASATFGVGEAALLENLGSSANASLRVRIWGGDASTLGMRYEPNNQ